MTGRLVSARQRAVGYLRGRPLLTDSLLALALLVVTTAALTQIPALMAAPNHTATLVWSAAGLIFVAIRRRLLWIAVAGLSVHTLITASLGIPTEGVAILILTFTAAAHRRIRLAALALFALWVPGLTAAGVSRSYTGPPAQLNLITFLLFNIMMALVAFLAGRIAFTRRRYVGALMERARTAEQNQRALAAQAVADERRRIARELHDMVAHHVSVMGVLATGSRRVLRKDPDTADEALATIEETSRTALRELRRLLDVLRTESEPAQPLAPQPGLAALTGLAEQVREAGVAVSIRTSSEPNAPGPNAPGQNAPGQNAPSQNALDPNTLDPGVGLTVYRIVQEALTNVLKHGGPQATAEVRLDVQHGWLIVEVFDTGFGPAAHRVDGVGHGLVGMRERVALYGGTLRTGPRPGGGFRVYARIPLDEGVRRDR